MVSLSELKRQAALVKSNLGDVSNWATRSNVEDLDTSYDKLYSMILDVSETLDVVISDIEK